jgi:hypothetical protein
MFLHTDDSLTLAFDGMEESTPQTLAECVSEQSLREITEESDDRNEVSKAERALKICQSAEFLKEVR